MSEKYWAVTLLIKSFDVIDEAGITRTAKLPEGEYSIPVFKTYEDAVAYLEDTPFAGRTDLIVRLENGNLQS